VEGFFQINLPVYEQALLDMKEWVPADKPAVDFYSGVGTIGLTIGGNNITMVEINEHAVREMERNITALQREQAAKAILAPSESALEHITGDATIIVDPPRAGLHEDVIAKLLEAAPERIVYLSCNPTTQARDVARLAETYGIRSHRGYNFFPRTPHIEHLVVLDKK
jgi:23S rRNA (uracil1939-C5)-methyltransferase